MKYNSDWDEHVATNLAGQNGDGDVAAPTGWFEPVTLQRDADGPSIIDHYGTRYLLVHESNEGFVTVHTYETPEDQERVARGLRRQYALYLAEISDTDAREAIDGYLQAGVHIGREIRADGSEWRLEGRALSWTGEAQTQAYADVVDFITENVEAIREWQELTGHGWLQVGIDFLFSRNSLPADFTTRPYVRPSVSHPDIALAEAARAFGPATVRLGEKGEIEFTPEVPQVGAERSAS